MAVYKPEKYILSDFFDQAQYKGTLSNSNGIVLMIKTQKMETCTYFLLNYFTTTSIAYFATLCKYVIMIMLYDSEKILLLAKVKI